MHPAKTDNLENLELPERQETQASRQQLHVNHQLHLHANLAHKDHPDLPDHQEAPETQEKLEPPDDQDQMLPTAHLDPEGHLDLPASPVQLDPMENQEFPLNLSLWYLENLENPVIKAQQDLLDHQDHQARTVPQDPLVQKASQAQMVPPVKTGNLDLLAHPADPEVQAKKEFARNTALSMEESSSRMEPDVKWRKFPSLFIDSDSQASRNAVFLIIFILCISQVHPSGLK